MKKSPSNIVQIFVLLLLALVAVYLVAAHYVKAYSDPVGFLRMAEAFMEGRPSTERALVYPAYLALALSVLGRVYVFLANLPWILLLVGLVFVFSVQLTRRSRDVKHADADAGWVGLIAACLFVFFNQTFLLEILNPFREPLAFSLMLGGMVLFFKGVERRRATWFGFAGLLLGLSVSTRETCILSVPPLLLLLLVSGLCERKRHWITALLVLSVGLAAGLAPSLIQNFMESGNVAVPGYAAADVDNVLEFKQFDIPIPGMSLRNFSTTSVGSLEFLLRKFGWGGWLLAVVGVIVSAFRRNRYVILVCLPSMLLNLLFYSFYWYVKERYLFVMDLFVVPLIALGIAGLLDGTIRLLPAWRPRAFALAALGAGLLALISMGHSFAAKEARLQVWDVPAFRSYLLPRLEKPYVFMGPRHSNFMLAWLLGGSSSEFQNDFNTKRYKGYGLEERLGWFGERAVPAVDKGSHYIYGNSLPPILKCWFDADPVLSFAEVPAPVDLYGHRLEEDLQKVHSWTHLSVRKTLPRPAGASRLLLMVDPYRLWDYPDRSFCRLAVDGREDSAAITNGVQFVPITIEAESVDPLSIELISDAPLPARPVFKAFSLNDDIDIALGASAAAWYYPWLSDELVSTRVLAEDGCSLFDRGTIQLPRFAGADREVFAEFRIEFLQEGPLWRKDRHTMTASSGEGGSRFVPLPPRRQQSRITVPLGRGTGGLDMVTVALASTLPSYEKQWSPELYFVRESLGLVKLYDVHIYTRPVYAGGDWSIDIGAGGDGACILEGVYDRETLRPGRNVRWTSPEARLSIQTDAEAQRLAIEITCVDARPPQAKTEPAFSVNGWRVPIGQVQREAHDGDLVYALEVSRDQLVTEGEDVLEIRCAPWHPREVLGLDDQRDLGVMLDTVSVRPVGEAGPDSQRPTPSHRSSR